MRTLIFSDLHWFDNGDLPKDSYEWVIEVIKDYKADRIIWLGDIVDLWTCPLDSRSGIAPFLDYVFSLCQSNTFIVGNHDYIMPQMYPDFNGDYLRHIKLYQGDRKYHCIHGDQTDFKFWAKMVGIKPRRLISAYEWLCHNPDIILDWEGKRHFQTLVKIGKAIVEMGLISDAKPRVLDALIGLIADPVNIDEDMKTLQVRAMFIEKKWMPNLIIGHHHDARYSPWNIWKLQFEAIDSGSIDQKSYITMDNQSILLGRYS